MSSADKHLRFNHRARQRERWWHRRAAHRPAGQWASQTSHFWGAGATCWPRVAGLARYATLDMISRLCAPKWAHGHAAGGMLNMNPVPRAAWPKGVCARRCSSGTGGLASCQCHV